MNYFFYILQVKIINWRDNEYKDENKKLNERIKDLEEKIKESKKTSESWILEGKTSLFLENESFNEKIK